MKTMTCDCCGGDLPARDVWEANRDYADDCDGSIDGKGRCRAFSRDELWVAYEYTTVARYRRNHLVAGEQAEPVRHACAACGKLCPVAEDETGPADDEVACDVRGLVVLGEYVCGECLNDAEDHLVTCCVCGSDVRSDADGVECVATDHGPDYVCGDCEYTGD